MKRNFINKKTKTVKRSLKLVHIGTDVWAYGKQSHVPGKGMHMVIYGPDRKEYHVWNNDVTKLSKEYDTSYSGYLEYNVRRHGNSAIQSKVKIYILTNILDNKDNWCFDLSVIPKLGKLKVICENGTVKNIEFTGKFYPQELVSKRFTWNTTNVCWPPHPHSSITTVNIVGYRTI